MVLEKMSAVVIALATPLIASMDRNATRVTKLHSLTCRILTAMCMNALCMDTDCTTMAFMLPTFGTNRSQEQGSTFRKRTATTSHATDQTEVHALILQQSHAITKDTLHPLRIGDRFNG